MNFEQPPSIGTANAGFVRKQESAPAAENNSLPPCYVKDTVLEVSYELTPEDFVRHFSPRLPLRQRLNQLLLFCFPLLLFVASYYSGALQPVVCEVAIAFYGLVGLTLTTLWGLRIWNARTHKTATYCVQISEDALSVKEDANPERRYPWAELGDICDDGEYFLFTSNDRRYLAVVPAFAFDDTDQANFFVAQSLRYWQAAQRGMPTGDEAVWPPAPRPGA